MKNSNVPPFCPICNAKLTEPVHKMNYVSGTRFCSYNERHFSVIFKHRTPTGQFNLEHEHVTQEIYKTKDAILNIFYDAYNEYPSNPLKANISCDYMSNDLIEVKLDFLKEHFRPKESEKFIKRMIENIAFL